MRTFGDNFATDDITSIAIEVSQSMGSKQKPIHNSRLKAVVRNGVYSKEYVRNFKKNLREKQTEEELKPFSVSFFENSREKQTEEELIE